LMIFWDNVVKQRAVGNIFGGDLYSGS